VSVVTEGVDYMGQIMIYIGSVIAVVWGIAHLVPTKAVVTGFGSISEDNKKVITMEWIAEGLTIVFIGALAFLVTAFGSLENSITLLVLRLAAVILIVMAILTQLTGARTHIIPIKLCPVIKSIVAVLFIIGSIA